MNAKKPLIGLLAIATLTITAMNMPLQIKASERLYGVDLAYRRRVVASGHTDDNNPEDAVDADNGSRYAAVNEANAYFYVDLGSVEKVGKVVIDWEAAYASEYKLQMSLNAIDWTTVATVTKDDSQRDEIVFPNWIEAKFVRFQGVSRAIEYGYSFYSFEVYGPQSLGLSGTVEYVSSNENPVELPGQAMLDNLAHTRWASSMNDDQYVLIDLNSALTFDLLKVRWEISFARIYRIYGHPETTGEVPARDDGYWTYIAGTEAGLGEVDTFKLDGDKTTRFIKVELVQRETSQVTKIEKDRLPWESTFSIYSIEFFDWSTIQAAPLGRPMEYSYNSPAWASMSNITLYDGGLILAPHGYPTAADGVVTDMASIADGDIPGFESYATYNPAVIYDEDREMFHMIYRSELPDRFDNYFGDRYTLGHMSTLSYAYSYDGVNFTRGENNPIAWPTNDDEQGGGLEDPRMFKIENDPNRGGVTTYYITYTMYNNSKTREGLIYTTDFETFTKTASGRLAPNYGEDHKSGTFLTDPEGNAVKIPDPRPGKHGEVYMIYMKDGGYTRIGFTTDVMTIAAEDIINIDTGGFGGNDIEDLTKGNESCMALTNIYGPDDQDIYLMYGGPNLSDPAVRNQPNSTNWFYALGVLKTTKSNPFELTNVRLDLDEPTMYPTDTNKIDYGLFDRGCMFADTMIRHDNQWYLYYGAGDMYVGLANARADFSAGASSYNQEGSIITANTMALNKRYEGTKTSYNIEYVLELRDLDGNLLDTSVSSHSVPHFTTLDLGKYSSGIPISVSINLDGILDLPDDYYLTSYIRDDGTSSIINNASYYLVVTPTVTHTPR